MILEIKHRLFPTASLLPLNTDELIAGHRLVQIASHDLPTLPEAELLLYLCAHGSRHSWFQLKWVADIGALVAQIPAGRLSAIARRAQAIGSASSLHQAVLLAHEILATPVPASLISAARADRTARRGLAAARQAIAVFGRGGIPFGFTTRLDLAEYRLRRGWAYRRAVFQRQALVRVYASLRPLFRMAAKVQASMM